MRFAVLLAIAAFESAAVAEPPQVIVDGHIDVLGPTGARDQDCLQFGGGLANGCIDGRNWEVDDGRWAFAGAYVLMVGWDRFVRVRLSAGYRRFLDGDQARCVSVDIQDTNICRNAELPGPIDDLYVGFSLGTAFDL